MDGRSLPGGALENSQAGGSPTCGEPGIWFGNSVLPERQTPRLCRKWHAGALTCAVRGELAPEAGVRELADDGGVADVAEVADTHGRLVQVVDVGAEDRAGEDTVEHGDHLRLYVLRAPCAPA